MDLPKLDISYKWKCTIQSYLILLCFTDVACVLFFYFNKLKVSASPALSKSVDVIIPTAVFPS